MKRMGKIVIKNKRSRKWFNLPKVKMPKVPKLTKNANLVVGGLLLSVYSSHSGNNLLYSHIDSDGEKGKPVIGAGRGGKQYGKKSAMEQMADSVAKPAKRKKKVITPYKPMPQMHTLWGIKDMRKGGI